MATKRGNGRRTFGAVRKLPSGRYQASYLTDAGRTIGPITFVSTGDADAWLATVQTDIARGTLRAAPKSALTVETYATKWLTQHKGLQRTTRALYESEISRYITPYLGDLALSALTPTVIRDWNYSLGADLADAQAARTHHSQATKQNGAAATARAYRTLRAILNTAVADELLAANPCKLKNAGTAPAAERPTLSASEVLTLADTVPGHYRAVVVLAAFVGPRIGEIGALRLRDVQLGKNPTATITRRAKQLDDGTIDYDIPKSAKGVRVLALPGSVAQAIHAHLTTYRAGASLDDLVFVTTTGRNIVGGGYSQAIPPALAAIGRPDVRVHDLRHTCSTLVLTRRVASDATSGGQPARVDATHGPRFGRSCAGLPTCHRGPWAGCVPQTGQCGYQYETGEGDRAG